MEFRRGNRVYEFLIYWLLIAGACSAAPVVRKVEPPNWWTGHSLNPVRVLVYGSGLQGAIVQPAHPLTSSRVSVSANGTHLFVDIAIPSSAAPGEYPLQIETAEGAARAEFRVLAPLRSDGRFQGFSPDDVIYLIMPDRFANGDPSNDDPAVSRGLFNRANSHFYHGGDLQGVIDHLPYLKDLGVTALWTTPIYDNNNHSGSDPMHAAQGTTDYHGYGTVDYYGVEEHFGTLDLLRRLVNEAHKAGIKVIQDQVANHVGPTHPWVKDPPTATWFNGTPEHHLKETFNVWNLIDPHASSDLVRPVLNGWFADLLPDLNQSDPEVARYEIQNALWWIGMAGFDGIRQDTLPYVPRSFWAEWTTALKRQYPRLRVVGEVLDANPAITSFFQGGRKQADGVDSGIDTVFDYPVYFSIREVFARGKPLESLIKVVANDGLYRDPASLVTILGDHDVPRFLSEPGATVAGLKLALTFLLTARGTPVLYYGDEIGMQGGNDPDNRRDFPGRWPNDGHNAFTKEGRTPPEDAVFEFAKKLNGLRAQLAPLRGGTMTSLAEGSQTWVYERRDQSGSVLVALNNGNNPAQVTVNLSGGEQRLHPWLGVTGWLEVRNGRALITLPARSAEMYSAMGP